MMFVHKSFKNVTHVNRNSKIKDILTCTCRYMRMIFKCNLCENDFIPRNEILNMNLLLRDGMFVINFVLYATTATTNLKTLVMLTFT